VIVSTRSQRARLIGRGERRRGEHLRGGAAALVERDRLIGLPVEGVGVQTALEYTFAPDGSVTISAG